MDSVDDIVLTSENGKNSKEQPSNSKGSKEQPLNNKDRLLSRLHKDTMFRGLFKEPKNFLHLLKKCSRGTIQLSEDDLLPFDLETEYIKRKRRNDVSFLTKDDKLIILVEHQSTLSPNFALKLFMYYFEVVQLWMSVNNIDMHGIKPIPPLPEPVMYIVYKGREELKETSQTFAVDRNGFHLKVTVDVVDIKYSSLEEKDTDNTLAGYSYFYERFDYYQSTGMDNDNSFTKARADCINAGFLKGFIEKEDFVMGYKDWLDYDAQVKTEGKEEKAAETALKMLKKGYSLEDIADLVSMPIWWVEQLKNQSNKKEVVI